MLKRTLERTITSGESMTHTARSQKLPPEKLIKFLIAAEGGPLAKELHRAGIDAAPAAVSQRRRQIPPVVFRKVFLDFRACLKSSNEDGNEGKRENLSRNKKVAFTIFPKSAEFVEPAEKTLYHPAAWQNDKLV